MSSAWKNDEEVQRLREYLKLPSVHPNVDYGDCVKFLKVQAEALELPMKVYELVPNKPVVIITWVGTEPTLPSILLNSHMDVVTVYEDHWSYPPFAAHITADGWLYARGSQDMKSVGMMHLEAVRRLKTARIQLKRTIHVSFVPDEEIGGADGMGVFSKSQEFKDLNIGFELDESMPSSDTDSYLVFYGERTMRQIKVTAMGTPGHGSLLDSDTAGEKLHHVIDKLMNYRKEQKRIKDSGRLLGDVTTVNLTKLEGGEMVNVLPESLSAYFDVRITPTTSNSQFDDMLDSWCKEAGDGVTYKNIIKNPECKNTDICPEQPFWGALEKAVNSMNLKLNPVVCPGATDARYIRLQGIPAISLTPLLNTPLLLHAHDERILVQEYKRGVDVMEKVVRAVATV